MADSGQPSSCDGCGAISSNLKQCGSCKQVKYCSRTCQKRAWKSGGHKDICPTLTAAQRALTAAATAIESSSSFEASWMPFLEQATVENVLNLPECEIGLWEVKKDGEEELIVTDIGSGFGSDETGLSVVGRGKCPTNSQDLCQAIWACMIYPTEDHCPRRPPTISLDVSLQDHHKYLWSEMLRIRVPVWLDTPEDQQESRACATFPMRRLGKYEKGEVFYEPLLKLRIEWWTDEQRRSYFEEEMGYGKTEEKFQELLDLDESFLEQKPRWMHDIDGYDSLEEAVKMAREEVCHEDLPETREEYWSERIYGWQLDYNRLEEACMDLWGAKSLEESVWDYMGVPRLSTQDKDADKLFENAGWECQGYKPGRSFVLMEQSVVLGSRLVEYNGFFWEEQGPPRDSMEDQYQSYLNTWFRDST